MTVTSQDKLHADRIMFAVRVRNKAALAAELAFLREDIIRCAVVQMEREFILKPRKLVVKHDDGDRGAGAKPRRKKSG